MGGKIEKIAREHFKNNLIIFLSTSIGGKMTILTMMKINLQMSKKIIS